jgi:hypothetical protein
MRCGLAEKEEREEKKDGEGAAGDFLFFVFCSLIFFFLRGGFLKFKTRPPSVHLSTITTPVF